jgi:hypothetical protein
MNLLPHLASPLARQVLQFNVLRYRDQTKPNTPPYQQLPFEPVISLLQGIRASRVFCLCLCGCMLRLFVETNDRSNTFHRNIGELPPDYTASHLRRQDSSVIIMNSDKKSKDKCEIITENVTWGEVYLVITNPALDLVNPWQEAKILQLSSLHVTVRRDRAATSLTHLYNGEIEWLRFSELKYSESHNVLPCLRVLCTLYII